MLFGIALTTAPLAFRRRYPATSFGVIMAAVIAASSYSTTVTFASAIFAAYSAATVKTHVARILGKLRPRDRGQAVVLAYETGLVSPGGLPQNAPDLPR